MVRRTPKDDDTREPGTSDDFQVTREPYIQLSFQLPAFYVRVLDGEAMHLGQRRSTLLEFLVLRKSGMCVFERAPSAPKYRRERGDLDVTKRFVWHVRPEIKERLDRLRERMGNLPPRTWVILALNEWIGLPSGVGDLGQPAIIRK